MFHQTWINLADILCFEDKLWKRRKTCGTGNTHHMPASDKDKDMGETEPRHCWWDCKRGWPLWTTTRRRLRKLKIELPYDPKTPFLGENPKEFKLGSQRFSRPCSLRHCSQQPREEASVGGGQGGCSAGHGGMTGPRDRRVCP